MTFNFKTASFLALLLDRQFKIGPVRFGLDPLLGLIPGIGDLISSILAFYLVLLAFQIKVPPLQILLMIGRIIIDFSFGLIPLAGDLLDAIYQSNSKNLSVLQKYNRP